MKKKIGVKIVLASAANTTIPFNRTLLWFVCILCGDFLLSPLFLYSGIRCIKFADSNNELYISADYIYNQQIRYIIYACQLYKNKETNNIKIHKNIQNKWFNDNPVYTIDKKYYISYNK